MDKAEVENFSINSPGVFFSVEELLTGLRYSEGRIVEGNIRICEELNNSSKVF